MKNVFDFRNELIDEYSSFSRSFTKISALDISELVQTQYDAGRYWPEPLIQINPNYQRRGTVQDLASQGLLHKRCADIFQVGKLEGHPEPLYLYTHQLEAIAKAKARQSFVVTTGTGSGKSLAFFIPIIDRILKAKEECIEAKTRAIVIYPMNALANSQLEELNKFLQGYPVDEQPFTVARYTGQESRAEREAIAKNPPDILLTNFMMLELILTRYEETDRQVVEHCKGLEFLILDELHTYRGRQGADVALLVRRLREKLEADHLVCIGTSATMSSTGTVEDRNKTVADVSTKLFGAKPAITTHDVIGETLERVTDNTKDVDGIRPYLLGSVVSDSFEWKDFEAFKHDPLAIWVELNLGIELPLNEKPRRAKPITLSVAAQQLALDADCSEEVAKNGLQRFLVAAQTGMVTPQGRPPFAFKLHQFISGPGKVHTTLEQEGIRHITLDAQRFAPGRQSEAVLLYPAHFCRECGQEYHPVWRDEKSGVRFNPREIDDVSANDDEDAKFGFLCPRRENQDFKGKLEDLPENWLDLSKEQPKVKQNYKHSMPHEVRVDPQGCEGRGEYFWYIPGKFKFCLSCSYAYEAHGKDMNRLSSLSGEGRSSATTMLTLSALRQLFAETDLPEGLPDPRKLLGFTDNRQDAALQAGHFNDFVFLLTLRAGLVAALQNNSGILTEEHLTDSVFKSLGFDSPDPAMLVEYLRTPKLMGLARQEAQRTLRFILGYRLLRDLRRGWRFNNPNLDQLKLLTIDYRGLKDFCSDKELFGKPESILVKLDNAGREAFCRIVFDEMRRSLCLESRYLDPIEQDKARNNAHSYLNERWAFATDEILATAKYLVLGKRPDYRGKPRTDLVSGGPRSRLLRSLKKAEFWKNSPIFSISNTLKESDLVGAIDCLLQAAANYGYVHKQSIETSLLGWRLNAAALDWCLPEDDADDFQTPNAFFRHLYLTIAETLKLQSHSLFEFEAHEHTAQVDASRRQLLEQRFRYTEKDRKDWADNPAHDGPLERLPVLFCSPTMELGVDISALNTVYLRNVPPTPANYAQRSGRAGRSGQQALVITYCAALSPHDQWFFHHANEMVHGVVRAPTLDLANRDLIESHLHAVWLASAEIQLENSIAPLIDLEAMGKPVKAELIERLSDIDVLTRARHSADRVVSQLADELDGVKWFNSGYVDRVINDSPTVFAASLERWRSLFDATRKQMDMADSIVKSHTASHGERENARRRYGDAARQYSVLLKTGNTQNSDFYTYRYLASQGFLPGYNFPRLPLMAWIPASGSSNGNGKDEDGSMVSRPRFLALSEFGPRSLIYHQGRMYRVVRAKLNVGSSDHVSSSGQLGTITARICSQCGYGHLGDDNGSEPLANCCENCGALLTQGDWVNQLYRIETVETVPVERISINDEERQRQGFELQTTYRFLPGPDGVSQKQESHVLQGAEVLAALTYSPAARLWRINRGWRRRKNKEHLGFYINPITGTWSKQDSPDEVTTTDAKDEPLLDKVPNQRIVPFVEDHRNVLMLAPVMPLSKVAMATLQAALKRGIEQTFQIEESELVAEPLPTADNRQALMFYEAAEGGAGVLTRLASEKNSLALVAAAALRVMHYRSPTGPWTIDGLAGQEEKRNDGVSICEAGCYQCLLSYFNQPDHDNIDRRNPDTLNLLVALANANVESKLIAATNDIPVQAGSTTAAWLEALDVLNLRRPDAIDVPVNQGSAVAAAQYKAERILIFLNSVTVELKVPLEEKGWKILDFSATTEWTSLFQQHPDVFGKK